ncbi:MAG: hypothetical protein ACLQDM_33045 [Bradyrhizobium sp.]
MPVLLRDVPVSEKMRSCFRSSVLSFAACDAFSIWHEGETLAARAWPRCNNQEALVEAGDRASLRSESPFQGRKIRRRSLVVVAGR